MAGECVDRVDRVGVGEGDEAEATRALRVLVDHHLRFQHASEQVVSPDRPAS